MAGGVQPPFDQRHRVGSDVSHLPGAGLIALAAADQRGAGAGNNIWAERYDRKLEEIFELQDEITLTIAAAELLTLASG